MREMKHFCLMIVCLLLTSCAAEWCNPPGKDDTEPSDGFPAVHEPVTEMTDSYEISYQYQDGVTALNAGHHEFVTRIEEDSILYLSDDLPAGLAPTAGSIWTSGASETLPYGLGCRIVSVEETSDGYKVVTSPVALDAIFKDLRISGELPLSETGAEGRADIGSDNLFEYQNRVVTDNNGFWEGHITMGAVLKVELDLKERRYDIGLSTNYAIAYKMGMQLEQRKKFEILPYKERKLKTLNVGPLVLCPTLGIHINGEAGGKVELGLGGENGATVTTGIRNGRVYRKEQPLDENGNLIDKVQWDGYGYVQMTVCPTIKVGVYTRSLCATLQPDVTVKASADYSIANDNPLERTHQLTTSIDLDLGASLDTHILWLDMSESIVDNLVFNLCEKTWNLTPKLVSQEGGHVTTDGNRFEHKFVMDGCPMMAFQPVYPYLAVYRNGQLVKRYKSDKRLTTAKNQEFTFTVEKDTGDTELLLCPGVCIDNHYHETDGRTVTFTAKKATWEMIGFGYTESPTHRYWYDEYIEGSAVDFKISLRLTGSEHLYLFGVKFSQPEQTYEYDTRNWMSPTDGVYELTGTILSYRPEVSLSYTLYIQESLYEDKKVMLETYTHPMELSCCTYSGDDIQPAMCDLKLERVGD